MFCGKIEYLTFSHSNWEVFLREQLVVSYEGILKLVLEKGSSPGKLYYSSLKESRMSTSVAQLPSSPGP